MEIKRLNIYLITTASILLIPLLAMQFTEEVNWTLSDFIMGGVLLMGTSLMIELVLKKVKTKIRRIALFVALFMGLLLVWAELAVGIFNSPFAGH